MTYARLSVWRFKKGQHQIGLKALHDTYLPMIRAWKGYRGHVHLADEKDPDTIVFITMWSNEEDFTNSMKELFNRASKELEGYFVIMPDVTLYKVKSAELLNE